MKKQISYFAAALLLAFYSVGSASINAEQPGGADTKPNVRLATRIEALLKSLKQTRYQHTTDIDVAEGVVNCDCSGLVGYFLRHEFPEAYVSLKGDEAPWRKRPVAVTFYQTFVSASNNPVDSWQRVAKLMDAAPGDVLAWRKKTIKQGSTTGHVCMIAGKPQSAGDGRVRVRLIDSTRSPHEDDTRTGGKDGMGTGYKTFLVDHDGKCVGYLRGDREVRTQIALGRVIESRAITSHSADKEFIGLTTSQATELAKQRGYSWRIIRKDGKPAVLKWSIQDDRLNFVIERDRVVRVVRG